MNPQINCLGKMSPILRISTHMYGLSKEIDEKLFIFSLNLGMETAQIDCLGYMSPVLRISTHIDRVSKEKEEKMFIFSVTLGM